MSSYDGEDSAIVEDEILSPVPGSPESAAVPPELAVVPPDSAAMSPELAVVPAESAVVPPELAVMPPDSAAMPPELAGVPAELAVVPPELAAMSPDSAAMPPDSAAVSPVSAMAWPAARDSPPADDPQTYLSIVMCPLDGGVWTVFTCMLGVAASMILDGICLSLVLYDNRVGMTDRVSSPTPLLEHLAVIYTCRYLIEPFACAYINRYGFRYCLFFGSVFSVTWIALFKLFAGNHGTRFGYLYSVLAFFGGIGIGMIKTAFVVLISSLFIVNRETAHLCLLLGTYTGMLLIPPLTEFQILNTGWQSSLYLHLGLTCFTLTLWLLVATPVPLNVREDTSENNNGHRTSERIAGTVANKKLRFVPLTDKTLLDGFRGPDKPVGLDAVWLYENRTNRLTCTRNLTNMFRGRTIGSRPMYRRDILFGSNLTLLAANIKTSNKYDGLSVKMTSALTVDDVNEEKHNRFNLFSTAVTRVLRLMLNPSIWAEREFVVFAASEALIYGSCSIPVLFIKGTVGQKSSAEAMITLIAGCLGMLSGRSIGFLLHETSSRAVPLYHVGLVLAAIGLSLLLYCSTDDLTNILPIFGCYGFLWGYYQSMQNAVFHYHIFPLEKFINVHGQIALVRAVSSCAGLLTAVMILETTSNVGYVYGFAGLLSAAGGVCVALLDPVSRLGKDPANEPGPRHPHIVFNIKKNTLREMIIV